MTMIPKNRTLAFFSFLIALGTALALIISLSHPTYAAKATTYTEAYDRNLGAFRVVLKDVDASYSDLSIAVWSEADGQDDLKWYTPWKREDGA